MHSCTHTAVGGLLGKPAVHIVSPKHHQYPYYRRMSADETCPPPLPQPFLPTHQVSGAPPYMSSLNAIFPSASTIPSVKLPSTPAPVHYGSSFAPHPPPTPHHSQRFPASTLHPPPPPQRQPVFTSFTVSLLLLSRPMRTPKHGTVHNQYFHRCNTQPLSSPENSCVLRPAKHFNSCHPPVKMSLRASLSSSMPYARLLPPLSQDSPPPWHLPMRTCIHICSRGPTSKRPLQSSSPSTPSSPIPKEPPVRKCTCPACPHGPAAASAPMASNPPVEPLQHLAPLVLAVTFLIGVHQGESQLVFSLQQAVH